MNDDAGLDEFSENFQQEVISRSQADESLREDKFTELMTEYLSDADEIDDALVCYHKAHGIKVNAYEINENEDNLDLFISIYTGSQPPVKVPKNDIDISFKRANAFLEKCFNRYYLELEEASPVFDMANRIYEIKDSLVNVRIYLLTDGIVNPMTFKDYQYSNIRIYYNLWDIQRLYRLKSSGNRREAIEFDFINDFGAEIACLPMPQANPDYMTYMTVISGKTVVDLYGKYSSRLLERNVRSFLQVRGNVNKGIRKTIMEEPHMFLAYNNGLSATAEHVTIEKSPDGRYILKQMKDFQIVNGGQTTASIYNSYVKDKADVSHIYVPMKLTVLNDPKKMDIVVPRISECANSQNKVNSADFSANNPFHIKLQELSRTIWAPAPDGTQLQTHWYYERARGQYLDEKGREMTISKKKAFEVQNPVSQKFTKTDLAKFENTWNQLPHIVSRGAEKNFNEFTVRLKERGDIKPDIIYFQHLAAKAILFRQAEKIIQKQQYGGYRANDVTYTLAWIFHETGQRIDLDRIWKEQSLSPAIIDSIIKVSRIVHEHITHPPDGKNITEWCKKEDCWKRLLEFNIDLPDILSQELIGKDADSTGIDRGIDRLSDIDKENISKIKVIPAETWFKISSWARETNSLLPWQRGLSYSLGKINKKGINPTRKQASQGLKILDDAQRLGFKISDQN